MDAVAFLLWISALSLPVIMIIGTICERNKEGR